MTPAPAAETVKRLPSGPAPSKFDIAIGVVTAFGARVSWTSAATPDARVLVFRPVRRHVYEPATPAQDGVLPEAEAAAPVPIETAEIWPGGYVSVHCKAAGAVPETEITSGSVTVLPGLAIADDKLTLEVCAAKRVHVWARTRPANNKFNVCRRINRLSEVRTGPGLDWDFATNSRFTAAGASESSIYVFAILIPGTT